MVAEPCKEQGETKIDLILVLVARFCGVGSKGRTWWILGAKTANNQPITGSRGSQTEPISWCQTLGQSTEIQGNFLCLDLSNFKLKFWRKFKCIFSYWLYEHKLKFYCPIARFLGCFICLVACLVLGFKLLAWFMIFMLVLSLNACCHVCYMPCTCCLRVLDVNDVCNPS